MTIERDAEGYLVEPDDWNEELAQALAGEEDLELNEEAWSVLRFMREYYDEHKIAPDIRHVAKHLAEEKGWDKHQAKDRIFELFPYGYVKQTCKIAGMKRPRGWSTG
jgi:tRNA 2-thiouridine synthesizing protein E